MAADTGAASLGVLFVTASTTGQPPETLELAADAHFGVGLDGIGLEDSEEHR